MRLLSGSFLLFALLDVTSLAAQQSSDIDQLFQIGTPDKAATLPIPMGEVNLSNGNLHLEIPLKTVPQRGTLPPVTVKLVYDSQFWLRLDYTNASYWYPGLSNYSGWRIQSSTDSHTVTAQVTSVPDPESYCNPTGTSTVPVWSNFVYTEPSGTSHLFYLQFQQVSPCDNPPGVTTGGMYADDGSGYFMSVTTDNLGGLGQGTVSVWDPHGNHLYNGYINGASTGFFVDSNGNSPTYEPFNQQGFNLPGFTITNGGYYVNTNFTGGGCSGCGVYDYSGAISNISSVTLPDGRSYSFQYDQCPGGTACSNGDYHYGLLTKMTLPTGATITFNHQNLDTLQMWDVSDLRVTSVSMSGEVLPNCAATSSWSGQTWSICYHLVSYATNQIDVTQPSDTTSSKNLIVYTGGSRGSAGEAPPSFIVTTESSYQGSSQSGSLLRRESVTYDTFERHITDVAILRDDQTTTHTSYSYWADYLPMVSAKKEYDTSGALARETDISYTGNYGPGSGYPYSTNTSFPHNIDRPFTSTIYGPGGSNGTPVASRAYTYDDTPLSTTSGVAGLSVLGQSSHDDANFGSNQLSRGNLTGVSEMVQPGVFITTRTNYYNILGQVVSSTDGNNHTTSFDYYSSVWGDNSCASDTLFNYQTIVRDALNHETHTTYNSCDGSVQKIQDQNDLNNLRNGTVYTYDSSARVHQIDFPDGGRTTNDYGGSSVPVVITTSVATDNSATQNPLIISKTLDGLGNTIHQTSANGAVVDTSYDSLGNVQYVSNPHFGTPNPTDGITQFTYDALGRLRHQTQPDGSSLTWTPVGDVADYFDEAGVHWRRTSDALGRLVQVIELGNSNTPINLVTDYGYNPLNQLTSVTQHGTSGEAARTRSYSYDGMGRLTSTNNPESGPVGYVYDNNGNLFSSTEARGITTSYTYDALNRLTDIAYSDGTPARHLRYDQGSVWMGPQYNTIGRLSQAATDTDPRFASSVSNPALPYAWTDELYSYDAMGRLTTIGSAFPSESGWSAHGVSVSYDLAGNMTSLRYPDGRVVTQGFDGTGHLQNVTYDNWNGQHIGYNYLSSAIYWPDGSTEANFYGNGDAIGYHKNNRMQIDEIGVVRIGVNAPGSYTSQVPLSVKHYCFGPSTAPLSSTIAGCPALANANNGNIWQTQDSLNNSYTQTFGYDNLNRLSAFSSANGNMQQNYSYDSFGNLSQSGTLNSQMSYDASNHISTGGYTYDAAGNIIQTNIAGIISNYAVDAANRIFNVNSGGAYYTYDANGNRMRKDVDGTYTEYQYLSGRPIAEKRSDGTWSDYIYANGQRIARADGYDIRIHMSGTNCSNCGSNPNMYVGVTSLTAANGYTIRNGDLLTWRQYQDGSTTGGLFLYFTDHTAGHAAHDTDGQLILQDTTMNRWHMRTVDLSQFAGKTIQLIDPFQWTSAPAGSWDIYYGDISLVSTDGSVIPIYNRTMTTLGTATNSTVSNFSAITERLIDPTPLTDTTYYFGDQVGSIHLISAGAGWPVATNTFYPFGQQPSMSADPNHYKFAAKERDFESGLDYFGARYYNSGLGRFASPDFPFMDQNTSDPQSWNMYSYVRNEPLTKTDPDGTCAVIHAGIGQEPDTKNGKKLIDLAAQYGANVAFPYEGESKLGSVARIGLQGLGANDAATSVSDQALTATDIDSRIGGTGFFSLGFSGGASSSVRAGGLDSQNAAFYDPGLGIGQFRWNIPTYHGGGLFSNAVNATSILGPPYSGKANCTHDVTCAVKSNEALKAKLRAAGPCILPRIFTRNALPVPLTLMPLLPSLTTTIIPLFPQDDNTSITMFQDGRAIK